MEATIKLKISELDNSVIEKIKSLFASNQDAVLTISIGGSAPSVEEKEADYNESLYRSKNDLENKRNLISFTMEELEAYATQKRS